MCSTAKSSRSLAKLNGKTAILNEFHDEKMIKSMCVDNTSQTNSGVRPITQNRVTWNKHVQQIKRYHTINITDSK